MRNRTWRAIAIKREVKTSASSNKEICPPRKNSGRNAVARSAIEAKQTRTEPSHIQRRELTMRGTDLHVPTSISCSCDAWYAAEHAAEADATPPPCRQSNGRFSQLQSSEATPAQ